MNVGSLRQARNETKIDKEETGADYFAFGQNSPKQPNQDELDGVHGSRGVDDWLLGDNWAKTNYTSVPDSEAATAIESILNDELN